MPTKPKSLSQSNVDIWLSQTKKHQRIALENASREFDKNDAFTVNTLEAIYGQESSFGKNLRSKGIKGAAGHFHIELATAERLIKRKISRENDIRFDVDESFLVAVRYLLKLNNIFAKGLPLYNGLNSIAVDNINERKIFAIASYNAGEGTIAMAQLEAKNNNKNPQKWNEVKNYLKDAGIYEDKVKEIIGYVENVTKYEEEFSKKSTSDKTAKYKEPLKNILSQKDDGHWITVDGKHIFTGGKNA